MLDISIDASRVLTVGAGATCTRLINQKQWQCQQLCTVMEVGVGVQ